MYYHSDPKKTIPEIVEWIIDVHSVKNAKQVLVHPDMVKEEISHFGIKITPKRGILPHHYWFISENKHENYPKFAKFEK